ncbi:MAG: nucleotidyltransferase domain-containing protein [Azoarcus sp.]|jgi:predicted nucleotidyltransferase|nr:nucleotidyltransferase domain-containing protein [Azoarcus sp.]
MSIHTEIETRPRAIEMEHGARILCACESGGHGWGFASPRSDYDVRALCVHPLSWYLRVLPGRDVIEPPIPDVLDINGWDVLRPPLAARGIPPMRFQALVDGIVAAPDLRQAIGALLDKKRAAVEMEYGPSLPVINDFIDTQLARQAGATPPVHDRIDLSPLDGLLMEAVLPPGGNA